MNLLKNYEELLKDKKKVLLGYYLLPDEVKQKTDLSGYCKKNHKEYFNKVIKVIHYLGNLTLNNGHSQDLDIQKDKFYKLLGL